MTAIGSLRVELELADGSFTTRVIRAGTTLQQLENQLRKGVVAVRTLDSSMTSFGGGLRDMVVTLGLARAAVENLYNVFGRWLTSIVRVNAEVERSITLLKNMSQASTEVERTRQARREFEELLTLSSQAPFRLETLTNAFVKMRAAGIEPAAGQLRSLADAVAAMGGTDDQFSRAAVAIQQMAGKGVISMEELRQQLGEAVPRALELMARSMNMTVASFVQKVSQGQVEARTALASLSAEFNRTFGGSAIAQMDTFNGKLVQLQTAWTRFSLVVGGEPGSGGFFDSTKAFLQQLTDILNSQDAQDFGARLNRNLSELTKSLTEGVRVLVDWSGAIEQAARALLVFWAAVRGYAILSGFLVALNALRLRLLTLPLELAAATTALNGFRNAAAGAAAASFTSRIASFTAGILEFGSALFGAVSRLGVFSRLLIGIGSGGLIVAALSLIGAAFDFVRGKANDAAEAVERFKEGASDKETLKQVESRINAIDDEIAAERALAEEKRQQLERDKASRYNPIGNRVRTLSQYGGAEANPSAARELQQMLEARETSIKEHNDRVIRLLNEQAVLRAQLEGANEDRRERAAEQFASRELARLQGQIRQITNVYDQQANDIAKRRAALSQQNLSSTEKEAADLGLNNEKLELNKKLYDSQIKALDEYIKTIEERREKAADNEKRNFDVTLKRVRELRDQIERERAAGNLNGDIVLLTANAENNIKVAQNEIARMNGRIAEMKATIAGTNPELAQMEVLLADLGRLKGLPPDLQDQLRKVAEDFGKAKNELTLFQKTAAGVRQIKTGLDKAAAEVAFFKEKLEDIDLPDEERKFVQFERAMLAAFENVAAAADVIPDKINEIRNAMLDAIDAARQSANLSILTNYLEGQAGDLAKLAPKGSQERLSAKVEILRKEYERARGVAIRTLSGDELVAALNKADERFRTKSALAAQQNGKEAESAGRKTANMLETLQARVAELGDELNNGAGEWAKYSAKLGEAGSSTAAGQQILSWAKQVDELTKKVETAQTAWSALKNLARQGDEGRNELTSTLEILRDGGDLAGIDAPYLQAAARARRAIEDLRRVGVDRGRLTEAEQLRMSGLEGFAQNQLADQVKNWRQAQRQMRESLAETNADRRRIALENLDIEEKALRASIQANVKNAQDRMELEERLAEFIKTKREQIARDTEGPIAKMMRDWGNLSDNIESSFARAFDGMTDALTEFVMTGKLSFTSLANSLIRDLIRISIRAAASGIFNLLKPGGGGMDLLTSVGGWIGSFFSGGGTAAGASSGLSAHTGAIVGKGGKAITISDSLLAGAQRYHKGSLRPDELPAILQKGEAVFTADQLAELGRLNRSYEFVERSLGAINSALTAPMSAMPSMPAAPMSGAGGMAPPVTVNIINQSGQQLEATAGTPRMDIEGMIVDVVVSNIQRPGRMRDAVKGVV